MGQYYPVSSPVHRMDPRIKLVMTIAYVVMIFFCESYASYVVALLAVLIATLCSRVPVGKVLRSIRPLLFIILLTFVINLFFSSSAPPTATFSYWTGSFEVDNILLRWKGICVSWTGISRAVRLALRLMLLVMGPSLLTLTTTPIELTDGIESLLKPLTVIKFPVHALAMIMSMALRLIPTIMEETDKIILAQKARCADFDSRNPFKKIKSLLPVLIPLFVSSIRRADELAYAMDSRCYRGAKGRTKYKRLKTRFGDWLSLFGLCGLFFLILLLAYNWWGWGWVSLVASGLL